MHLSLKQHEHFGHFYFELTEIHKNKKIQNYLDINFRLTSKPERPESISKINLDPRRNAATWEERS